MTSQYDDLDRAFGVPDPAAPVNGMSPQPQRRMTPAEEAAQLLEAARDYTNTANLRRVEELTNSLEILYGPGVGYPFRDAIGELGNHLSTAAVQMIRAGRMYAEELDRLKAACDQWADDYRQTSESLDNLVDRVEDEQQRRRHAEEVLRQLEELPGFLEPPVDVGVGYRIDTDSFARLRRLIKVHTDYVAGMPTATAEPQPEPQPGRGPSLRDLLSELGRRLDTIGRGPHLARMCRAALDTIPTAELDRRPG